MEFLITKKQLFPIMYRDYVAIGILKKEKKQTK